jgi:hypothetical protein
MKNKSTKNPHYQKKTTPVTKSNSLIWMMIIVIVAAAIGIVFWRHYTTGKATKNTTMPPSATNVPAKPNQDLLIGRWVRTDSNGNYIIEISSATATGNLEASYFNPNPIKVGHAEWQKKNGGLVVIVELRDVNYPGSTYTLSFNPSENLLSGIYYQAVQGTSFDVAFVRVK